MKRVLSWVLAVLFGVSAFYVVYAHFASMIAEKKYLAEPLVESFASEGELARRFDVKNDLGTLRIAGGEAHVTGTTKKGAAITFVTKETALAEGRVAMRFKVDSDGPFDVVVGVEKTRGGKEGVHYGLRNEPDAPYWAWDGDELEAMPGLRAKGQPSEHIEDKARTPFAKDDLHRWHDVEIVVSTTLRRMAAFVDGVPTGTVFGEWLAGTPVRCVFGVRSRDPEGEPVDVTFSKLELEPLAGEVASLDFTDRFDGKVIDPRHWAVHSLNSELLSVSLAPTKDGLHAQGHASSLVSGPSPAFIMDSPEVPLGNARAKISVHVRELHHALFFMGIASSLGGPHLRFFDTGLHEDAAKNALVGSVSGHWGRDAQVRSDPPTKWTTDRDVTLEVEYDGKTRTARAKMDGVVIGEHASDLHVSEHVRVRFGVVLDDATASFDLDVREMKITARSD